MHASICNVKIFMYYIVVPGDVNTVNLICAPVNLISQCDVTWNVRVCEYIHTYV